MSDSPISEPPQAELTAGGLLRQARLATGLHIAALATSIKVAPRKLELLENDRFDELPGAAFTRALAQTVCRSLKIDSAPVLALLPPPPHHGLAQMSLGLNAPFRDRPGRRVPSDLQFIKSPILLSAAGLLVLAALVYLLPASWIEERLQRSSSPASAPMGTADKTVPSVSASASATPAASEPAPAASAGPEALVLVPLPVAAQAASAPSVPGVLMLRANAESWVEVIDGRGAPLMSRKLQAGETVGLNGASPLRVKIGNASATQVTFRGRAVDLASSRDNIAKLELK